MQPFNESVCHANEVCHFMRLQKYIHVCIIKHTYSTWIEKLAIMKFDVYKHIYIYMVSVCIPCHIEQCLSYVNFKFCKACMVVFCEPSCMVNTDSKWLKSPQIYTLENLYCM